VSTTNQCVHRKIMSVLNGSNQQYSLMTLKVLQYIQEHYDAKVILDQALLEGKDSLFTKNCPTRPEILRGSDILFRWCDAIKNLGDGKRAREKFKDEAAATLVKTSLQILVTELWCPMSATIPQLQLAMNGNYRGGKGVLTSALLQARAVVSELRLGRFPPDVNSPGSIYSYDESFSLLPKLSQDEIHLGSSLNYSTRPRSSSLNFILNPSVQFPSASTSPPQSAILLPDSDNSQSIKPIKQSHGRRRAFSQGAFCSLHLPSHKSSIPEETDIAELLLQMKESRQSNTTVMEESKATPKVADVSLIDAFEISVVDDSGPCSPPSPLLPHARVSLSAFVKDLIHCDFAFALRERDPNEWAQRVSLLLNFAWIGSGCCCVFHMDQPVDLSLGHVISLDFRPYTVGESATVIEYSCDYTAQLGSYMGGDVYVPVEEGMRVLEQLRRINEVSEKISTTVVSDLSKGKSKKRIRTTSFITEL
jgi:hypothetical protein